MSEERFDVIVGFNSAMAGEENYFYCDPSRTDHDVVFQAAVDYLYHLKPDATFPEEIIVPPILLQSEERENNGN